MSHSGLAITFVIASSFANQVAVALPVVNIGVVYDGDNKTLYDQMSANKEAIQEIGRGEFDIRFPESLTHNGEWRLDRIADGIDELLSDPRVSVVIAAGPVGSAELSRRASLSKPTIAGWIIDPVFQGVPLSDGVSGIRNFTYLASPKSFERDIAVFREMVGFDHVSVLVTDLILELLPELNGKVSAAAEQYQIEIELVPVGERAESALQRLDPRSQAVVVTPLARLSEGEFRLLIEGLTERKLPSLSLFGKDEVEQGILTSVAPASDTSRIARRMALNVQRILLGEDAGTLPVTFTQGERLVINMATARAIDFYPSWRFLSKAEVLNEEVEGIGRVLTLEKVAHEAVEANLDLIAAERDVAAREQDVRQARSALFPQVRATVSGNVRDQELANAQFPERSGVGSFELSQIVYSDSAWANLRISGKLQQAREEERNSLRLDIVNDTATGYLNILRAKHIELIRKENVKRSRTNLALAKVRVEVGFSNRADMFRWQSQIATDRQQVLAAERDRRQAEVRINQLLNRPQEELFKTREAGLDDPALLISDPRFFGYVDNPRTFRAFRDFLVREGLVVAPELRAFDVTIEAQKRQVLASKRDFWMPDVSLQSDYSETFARGGTGGELPPGVGDSGWSVGVVAELPLFTSGARQATLSQDQYDLARLQVERRSSAEKIEARIRNALHASGATYPSIELAREAASAANDNLELVTDQYRQGAASIIDLIDAQNAALEAELTAANAVADFLSDLIEVQRATSRFDFFLTAAERQAWYQNVATYFSEIGVPVSEHDLDE